MCIANATTATEEEIEITQEMIDAGLRELGIMCDLWACVSELTGADVCEVYRGRIDNRKPAVCAVDGHSRRMIIQNENGVTGPLT